MTRWLLLVVFFAITSGQHSEAMLSNLAVSYSETPYEMDRDAPPPLPHIPERFCEGYYDVMSFAPDVKCPVMMDCGLVDPIFPPFDVFAVYNLLGTKRKQIVPLTGLGHDWSAEFDRRAWRWLDQILKQKR